MQPAEKPQVVVRASTQLHGIVQAGGLTEAEAVIDYAAAQPGAGFETRSDSSRLRWLLEAGDSTVLEHASATVEIRDVSLIVALHFIRDPELVVSEHHNKAVVSDRSTVSAVSGVVVPSVIRRDEQLRATFEQAWQDIQFLYKELVDALREKLKSEPNSLLVQKTIVQAARSLVPLGTATDLLVTGNFRAWRAFIAAHSALHIDSEVRSVVLACLEQLRAVAPLLFADFIVEKAEDGTDIATSPYF